MSDWETEAGLEQLRGWSEYTLADIAKMIGVERSTLFRWAKKSPAIYAALHQIEAERVREVEESLFDMAKDRKKKVKIKKQVVDRDGEVHDLVEEREVLMPASFQAVAYILNNRDSGRWSQKPVAETNGEEYVGFIPAPEVEAALADMEDSTDGR